MVRRIRQTDDRAPRQSEAELDAILLRRFPSRTLEELDQMDWARYMRAMEAERVMVAEEQRSAFLGGTIKTMSEDMWKVVAENEELIRKYND